MFTPCSFDTRKIKLDYYRGKNWHEKYLSRLKRACNKNN